MNLKSFIKKYKSVLLYLFFGVCTTVINVFVYWLSYNVCALPNIASTIIAWVVAVTFAFFTNKIWVFGSSQFTAKLFLYELASFFLCRLVTGVLEVAIMYVTVDRLAWNGPLWKLLTNFIVIVLNYVASKLLIFRRNKK